MRTKTKKAIKLEAMNFLLDTGTKICDLMVEPICRQVGYIFNYKSNIDKLRINVQYLRANRNGLQQLIHEAERNAQEILVDVEEWMKEAYGLCEMADRILGDEEGHAKASCSCGSFPNLVLRHQLSRKAKKMASSLVAVGVRCHFDQVSCRRIFPSSVGNKGDEYEDFLSRKATMDKVMESLKDPNISMVGVYGMPGIGKTMFAKEASQRALDQKLFDPIILVAISHVPNLEKIQQEIAEKLGLKFEETILSPRADKLRDRMRREKKILIILDDVWNKFKLHDIGISFGSDQKGCKILLTSRFKNVVCDEIGVESFKLDLLSDHEAANLFYKKAGDSSRDIAKQIIKECACLPIAIVVVATALKNKPLHYWKDALHRLQKSIPMSKVNKSIKLSYDFLVSKEAKRLLLLCSIHEEDEDIIVEDLVQYGMGLDMFQGITKLKDARNRVLSLVDNLKACCLLLDGKSASSVKMHDVIRDVCLLIASQDERMHFIRDIAELEECNRKKKLVDSIVISLPSVNVYQLPKRLECSQLELLLMRHNGETSEGRFHHSFIKVSKGRLEEQFFEEMKDLRVLSLRGVKVKLRCFSRLQNLHTLCLRSCNLGDIAPIKELKNLEILDLARSKFLEVPREIGQLTRLCSLVLDGCYKINHVEPHVISSLKNLEQLNMVGSFCRWKVEGVKGEISNASPVELNNLAQLNTLNVYIPDVCSLPGICLNENLERYQIVIGNWPTRYFCYPQKITTSKMLKLKLENSHQVEEYGFEKLMKSAEELCLDGFEDVNDALSILDKDGYTQLEHFLFQNNRSVRYIINSSHHCAFSSLKSMFLEGMMNLEKICQGKLIAGSFGKLKKVSVKKCGKIKSLFSFSIAKQLEELVVCDCPALEEIGAYESEHESSNVNNEASNETKFCQLMTLRLDNLPKVTRFFWQEVENISMFERGKRPLLMVDSPIPLFSEKVIFPKLAYMELSSLKVKKLWQDKVHGASFMQNLTKLIVHNCDGMNYLLSYDVVKGLEQLEHLEVKYCKALEEVITIKKPWGSIESIKKMLLPKLHTLVLCNLQKLSRFCSGCHIEYPSLKVLKLKECLQLENLALIGELNNLEELDFSDWSSIVELPRGIERITQLKKLNLSKCRSLKVIQPNILSKLIHLQELEMLESPITWEAEGVLSGERTNASLAELKDLPQLTTLSLSLPDVSIVPKDLFSEKLDCYCIDIGNSFIYYSPYYYPRKLSLNLKKSELVREHGLQVLLKSCIDLHLHGFQDENDFLYNLDYRELFPQLLYVKVASCARFKHLFPYSFSNTIKLHELTVEDCMAMETIVTHEREQDLDYQHPNGLNFNKIELSHLWILTLRNLPRLAQFYSEVKTSVISYSRDESSEEEFVTSVPLFSKKVHMPNLKVLEMKLLNCKQIWHNQLFSSFNKLGNLKVSCCPHLKSLMSYSMVINLVSLRYLEVCNCEKMEEVISILEELEKEESLDLITFRKLEILIIKDLPELRRFSAANGVICPSLSSLTLIDCLNLTAFVNISTHVSAQHTFFGEKVIFPSLEIVKVGHSEIINEIFNLEGESCVNSFGKLKKLDLECSSHDESDVLLFQVSQRFQNLERFSVRGLAVENFFQHQELSAAEENENILPHLTTLKLQELPKLMHLFDQNVRVTNALSNLEILDIMRCYRLKSFIPPSMSFQCLTTLRVSECHGLMNLFASSGAKGLVNLNEMSIYGCESMTKIVEIDEVLVEKEIVFEQLETLVLVDLPSLRCFYSGNSTITFPNLQTLVVTQCPEMQIFSHGIVNSPTVNSIITELESENGKLVGEEEKHLDHILAIYSSRVKEECWEYNINDTIRKMFEQGGQLNQS